MGLSVNRKGRPVAARGRLDRCWLVTRSWPEAKIRLPSPASPQSTHTSHSPHMRACRRACLAPWGDQGGRFITSRSPT